jgi:Tol biopolymer transport system component
MEKWAPNEIHQSWLAQFHSAFPRFVHSTDCANVSLKVHGFVGDEVNFPSSREQTKRSRRSADGKSILTQGWDAGRQQGLFRVELQTEEVTPSVLSTGNEQGSTFLEWPSWSKEGTAFTVRHQDWAPRRIVRLGPNDEQVKVYVPKNPAAKLSHLAVSPDAKHVAFVESDFAAGETIVKIVAAEGGLARTLVRLPRATESIYGQAVFALAWMPDSKSILYVPPSSDGRQLKLWRVTVEGGKVKSLGGLVDAPQAFGLSVRPDGQQLALTAGTPLHSEAWVLRHIGKKVAP